MSSVERVLSVTAYGLIFVSCQFSLYVIRKYHNSKPLGMQTLHGKVIVLFTKVLGFLVAFFACSFTWRDLVGLFPRNISIALWFAIHSTTLILFLTFLAMIVTKYSSIYHGALISEINETK